MNADRHLDSWSKRNILDESLSSSDIDNVIEKMAIRDLVAKRLNRQRLLASDIFCRSTAYKPIRSLSLSNRYQNINPYHSIASIELPRVNPNQYQIPFCCKNCHSHDFSYYNVSDRQPSYFPLAQKYHRLQTDYNTFHTLIKRKNLKQRWKIYGFILIFYFTLKNKLRVAKQKHTYYQHNYDRIRFLELLTVIHRVYLDPNSSIYQTLSYVIKISNKLLNQTNLFHCVQTILDQITNFLPKYGIVGTNSDESVLIYLLNCSLEQYPSTYFWSIEKHLLSLSYLKMKENKLFYIDHFTTKFLLISIFIFHGLIKTLLFKPVKYRLIRGQLNRTQWLNLRLLSTLILYIARHAILYKEDKNSLPMPFPFEMNKYLIDDEELINEFEDLMKFVKPLAFKLSAWACKYAERLQSHMRTNTKQ
ncbi:unnamed protein product [Adineta steineri]|uniref:Uncharacterized protein n=1 Tax=Adineta steineri TaxID=433720 RepID=A0A815ALV6_9BILA|nr:unnamed protein product [Adineta steineri]CAF3728362.1 unnamed protein product [Adineta steineri]